VHVKELTVVYSLLLTTTTNTYPSELVLSALSKLTLKLPEAMFLSKKCEIYVIHKTSNQLERLDEILNDAESHLKKVEDVCLRERYAVRVAEIKSITSLFVYNDLKSAREFSKEILDKIDYLCDKLSADSYYRMGMSFFSESPDMCLHYLKKCADKLEKAGLVKEASNIRINEIEFVKVHWGVAKSEEELTAPESKAHLHAINNDSEKASEYTSMLNQESPFTLYYKGMADKNVALLIESALIFKNRANRFYAELPLRLLEEMPGMSGIVTQIRQ
jgi:CRISPR/Cas system CMR-associated protein Cmr5 small subunit